MVRPRLALALGASGFGVVLASALFHCAEPTQIVVDVRTDGCLFVKSTGIAVAKWDNVDTEPLSVFKNAENGSACETQDRIGTLTVYPSGDDKEGEVAVRIVAGVDKPATACAPPWDGCMIARRRVRFVPGQSQQLIVIVSLNCKGKDCGLGGDCTPAGECVRLPGEDVVPPPPRDGGADAPPADAGTDACALCTLPGQTCSAGTCTTDCSRENCRNAVCPPPLDCAYTCPTNGSCTDVSCQTTGACRFDCSADRACVRTSCRSARCDFDCRVDRACEDFAMSGGDAGAICRNSGQPCQGTLDCDAGKCTLSCSPGGGTCPDTRRCATAQLECVGPW